ncbi:HD domain-containing protein [Candidatus Saccharibacteria bacterium]|nr:HD domain-containing protein [Candidatus Saccharibacteria bacterium]
MSEVDKLQKVREKVIELLGGEKSGHDYEHIERVAKLAVDFAKVEKDSGDDVNIEVVILTALLHDVDDYKIFGQESADNLLNAHRIMDECGIDKTVQEWVCANIHEIGYRKRLKGISPVSLEGMIVSDADMCDAMGTPGILRTHAYCIDRGYRFFNKDVLPVDEIDGETYSTENDSHGVTHFFEKLLRLRGYMLTRPGKEEAAKRHQIMVDFLENLFRENDATEWMELLDRYR